jgi:hypothetical protein
MDPSTPFAHSPATPESISAEICRQLTADYATNHDTQGIAFAAIADAAVHEVWGGRVTTFVPVLALRQARSVLHAQGMTMPPRSLRSPTS